MFMSLIRKRRSTRRFLDKPVEKAKLDLLVEAALRAPSSRGINPWHFVVVTDPEMLGRLSEAKENGSAFLKNAGVGIVVCADASKSDVWVEDASIAAIMIHLAAESLDLGSCWIQIRQRRHDSRQTSEMFVAETLSLPPQLKVVSILGIGYPDDIKTPHSKESLAYAQVHAESYGNAYHI
jgi:nitroreductase